MVQVALGIAKLHGFLNVLVAPLRHIADFKHGVPSHFDLFLRAGRSGERARHSVLPFDAISSHYNVRVGSRLCKNKFLETETKY